jgi:hypothetical protein
MGKYRGFVGQVAPLNGLGVMRVDRDGRYSEFTYTGNVRVPSAGTPPLVPREILPVPEYNQLTTDQELEAKQYKEGGDGRAELLEKEAKIYEAINRAKGTDAPVSPEVPPTNLLPLLAGAVLIYLMK